LEVGVRPGRLEYKWVALSNTTLGMLKATISSPFHTALVYAFVFAIVACLIAAVASLLRGGKYHHADATSPPVPIGLEPVEPLVSETPSSTAPRPAEKSA
jgi:hypothetical protein